MRDHAPFGLLSCNMEASLGSEASIGYMRLSLFVKLLLLRICFYICTLAGV